MARYTVLMHYDQRCLVSFKVETD